MPLMVATKNGLPSEPTEMPTLARSPATAGREIAVDAMAVLRARPRARREIFMVPPCRDAVCWLRAVFRRPMRRPSWPPSRASAFPQAIAVERHGTDDDQTL